jgi:predicted deacylase
MGMLDGKVMIVTGAGGGIGREHSLQMARAGAAIVVNSSGRVGTLRRSATEVGIPAITVEAGESARFDALHAAEALDGILRLLAARKMLLYDDPRPTVETTAYLRTRWLRADHGGILVSQIRLGDEIYAGQNVGTISDPLSDRVTMITSPLAGRVIGAAIDQVVMPGFAAFHVGYDARPFNGVIGEISVQPEVSAEEGSEGVDLEERPE